MVQDTKIQGNAVCAGDYYYNNNNYHYFNYHYSYYFNYFTYYNNHNNHHYYITRLPSSLPICSVCRAAVCPVDDTGRTRKQYWVLAL